MVRPLLPALAGLVLLLVVAASDSQSVSADAAASDPFVTFVDEYYAALFAWDPNQASFAGIHEFDGKLCDLSAEHFADRAATLKKQQARLSELRSGKLTGDEAIDAELLDNTIRAELLEIETVRDWNRNPVTYLVSVGKR